MDIYDCSLPTLRILIQNGIDSMDDLLALRRFQRRMLKGMNPKAFAEVDEAVKNYRPRPVPREVQVLGQLSIFDLEEMK